MIQLPRQKQLLFLFSFLMFCSRSIGQDLQDPGKYMSYVDDKKVNVTKTYLNYLSAVSHGKSARKVEKLREKVLNTIYDTRIEISGVPPFKGDKTLRDATVAFLKKCYSVFNEDYGKIVNMEEIAEQSYDAMEAYILAQQKASEKLDEAAEETKLVEKQFAASHNVNLVEGKDELSLKSEQSGKVLSYYNTLFLIFFKSNWQDKHLTDAINASNLNAIEQNKNALQKYSTEGLQALQGIDAFQSDLTVVTACKKILNFYKEMCESRMQSITDFLLANENFKKQKKQFDAIPAAKRTQADVDNFNKTVKEVNGLADAYNKSNKQINSEREALLDQWEKAVNRFMDVHIPYSR